MSTHTAPARVEMAAICHPFGGGFSGKYAFIRAAASFNARLGPGLGGDWTNMIAAMRRTKQRTIKGLERGRMGYCRRF